MIIESSTITNFAGPDYAPSAIFIGSFNANVPRLTLSNTLITANRWYACEWRAAGTVQVISSGNNLVQDDSCQPVAGDIITATAQVDPLANNGGPTQTHALIAGSQAINAAGAGPATDQRGVTRGTARDIGSYEAP
jgi:hypothetical protein